MSDLIYRQEAIDAVWSHLRNILKKVNFKDSDYDEPVRDAYKMAHQHLAEVIERLPAAEPELNEWCTDCKEYDQERHCCPRWNRVIRETLKDAGLERKKGRWQITDAYPHNVYCSECHVKFAQTHWAVWEDGSLPRNFCPNCGADMRGE